MDDATKQVEAAQAAANKSADNLRAAADPSKVETDVTVADKMAANAYDKVEAKVEDKAKEMQQKMEKAKEKFEAALNKEIEKKVNEACDKVIDELSSAKKIMEFMEKGKSAPRKYGSTKPKKGAKSKAKGGKGGKGAAKAAPAPAPAPKKKEKKTPVKRAKAEAKKAATALKDDLKKELTEMIQAALCDQKEEIQAEAARYAKRIAMQELMKVLGVANDSSDFSFSFSTDPKDMAKNLDMAKKNGRKLMKLAKKAQVLFMKLQGAQGGGGGDAEAKAAASEIENDDKEMDDMMKGGDLPSW
jgi:uncharacterized phage infection (PIP) family protein YhgE